MDISSTRAATRTQATAREKKVFCTFKIVESGKKLGSFQYFQAHMKRSRDRHYTFIEFTCGHIIITYAHL